MLKKLLLTLEGLDPAIAALYKEGADKKFHLDVEDDDHAELIRAKDHEVGLRRIAEQERDNVQAELVTTKTEVQRLTASQSTGVQELRTQLEAEYGTQINNLKTAHGKEKMALESSIKRVFVDNVADGIAKDISIVPELLSEVLKKRLSVEMVAGEPITRVLTADGKASPMTPDELKNEYFTNEKYASIMRASNASGGGAANGGNGGGASIKFGDLDDAGRKALLKSNPTEFHRQVALEEAAARK